MESISLYPEAQRLGLKEGRNPNRSAPTLRFENGNLFQGYPLYALAFVLDNNEWYKWHGYTDSQLVDCWTRLLRSENPPWVVALLTLAPSRRSSASQRIRVRNRDTWSVSYATEIGEPRSPMLKLLCDEWIEFFGAGSEVGRFGHRSWAPYAHCRKLEPSLSAQIRRKVSAEVTRIERRCQDGAARS